MKKTGLLSLTFALSLALSPSMAGAETLNAAGIDSQGNTVEIGHELPKAKTKGKEKFDKPSKVEKDSVADVLDESGKKIKKTKIKKNDSEELFGLFDWLGGGGSGGGTTEPPATTDRTVTVLVAVDEEYRAAHSDWQTLTTNIVEKADDGFIRDHSIDYDIKAFAQWTSNGNNASEILQDLDRDFNGNGYDFVVGFTRDTNFNSGGIAYVYPSAPSGSAISVNLDQGAQNTWHAAQHEFSHNYGLGHDAQGSGIQCIMNYDYAYQVDFWDGDHDNEIEAHRTWYGN
ncbi:zinc-dependent metalloprotease [Rossellomorea aquimaris]|uniref:zinc-dependent metalloprotease n=1 Tax=Rossellomorea aquimaris TaxID=189382 RepID=UPI001CD76DE2|nr:zinc-dependent metalloprotease [Rossellomorea aquimaris]MCA1054352.1 zinc-dependent metalloprotease [Rossellomorea aquimaris]